MFKNVAKLLFWHNFFAIFLACELYWFSIQIQIFFGWLFFKNSFTKRRFWTSFSNCFNCSSTAYNLWLTLNTDHVSGLIRSETCSSTLLLNAIPLKSFASIISKFMSKVGGQLTEILGMRASTVARVVAAPLWHATASKRSWTKSGKSSNTPDATFLTGLLMKLIADMRGFPWNKLLLITLTLLSFRWSSLKLGKTDKSSREISSKVFVTSIDSRFGKNCWMFRGKSLMFWLRIESPLTSLLFLFARWFCDTSVTFRGSPIKIGRAVQV